MMRYGWHFCWWLLGLLPLCAEAQVRKGGDGLVGVYYDGRNFERKVLTRHDPVINFDWHQQPPCLAWRPRIFRCAGRAGSCRQLPAATCYTSA
ncbi:hypothetical protein [Hymenobacter sp. BRD67]|uniref:hypothetical protein n=1 Tax=Hymenobacter sp. BRD67 TaxID=2675877 RepID=UPI0015668023|nr:hypothetical protein [Hymenobacter sp. BRD67]QKG53900.1 hypothetical protein GKZ67_16445 [Hymenobacter sp. BRD67]